MALKTTVIIREVTNLSDARYCAGMGVDYISFRIDRTHPKYVDLANYNEITNWIEGIKFIGESSVVTEQKNSGHKINQLLLDDITLIKQYSGSPALWSIPIEKMSGYTDLLSTHLSSIDSIIITSQKSVISEKHKTQIKDFSKKFNLFLSYGITSENVLSLIRELPIKGISLKGSDEIRVGFKDYDELANILEQLEKD